MSAIFIGKMSSEDMVNSYKNYECLSLNYGMSNVTEAFLVDVSIYGKEMTLTFNTNIPS